jgi:hypothetical protein
LDVAARAMSSQTPFVALNDLFEPTVAPGGNESVAPNIRYCFIPLR